MSETKRIRYKSIEGTGTGPFGAVVHNDYGMFEPGDEKDLPANVADSLVASGGFEFVTNAETIAAVTEASHLLAEDPES